MATFRILEPSWVYYAKQPIAQLPKRDKIAIKPTKAPTNQMVLHARMNNNSYNFIHANGNVKPKSVPKIDVPKTD